MSNDITKYNPADIAYLGAGAEDQELAEFRKEVNPFSVMPRITLSKDTKEIRLVLGEESIKSFSSKDPMLFVPILIAESRALFRPGNSEDSKQPVCSTPRVPIGQFKRDDDKGVGKWNLRENIDYPFYKGAPYIYEEGEPVPDRVDVRCKDCKWNQFKSASDWDPQKGGKGKACGESRFLIGRVAYKVGELGDTRIGIYEFNKDEPMVYGRFSPSSLKAIQSIMETAVARRVPARKMVFALSNDPQKDGQMSWGELRSEFVGFVSPNVAPVVDESNAGLRELVFAKQVDLEPTPEDSASDDGVTYVQKDGEKF